jgi:integrase
MILTGPRPTTLRHPAFIAELLGFLTHLESEWGGVTVGPLLAKVYLWSAGRQEEVTSLRWGQYREIEGGHHFHIVGKRGVQRLFRVPDALCRELLAVRVDPTDANPFVFAAYNRQLRVYHERSRRPHNAHKVGEDFKPRCLGDWFYDRLAEWSATVPNGHAHPHVFRKTALQQAWGGREGRRAGCPGRRGRPQGDADALRPRLAREE